MSEYTTHNLKKRILYVEGDADTREMVRLWLSYQGFEVSAVVSATEALPVARAGGFSLYILDARLPDGDGVELCKQIRDFDPASAIIFVSGAAFPDDIRRGLEAGAQLYLTKPVELTELHRAVLQYAKSSL